MAFQRDLILLRKPQHIQQSNLVIIKTKNITELCLLLSESANVVKHLKEIGIFLSTHIIHHFTSN